MYFFKLQLHHWLCSSSDQKPTQQARVQNPWIHAVTGDNGEAHHIAVQGQCHKNDTENNAKHTGAWGLKVLCICLKVLTHLQSA